VALLLASACASNGTYNRNVDELTKLREADDAAAKQREQQLSAQLDAARKSYVELQSKLADVQTALDKANADKTALQKQLDDDTQLVTMNDTAARLEDRDKRYSRASRAKPPHRDRAPAEHWRLAGVTPAKK
jgi:DNA repair exonuclease SbcCD ATPase subunit